MVYNKHFANKKNSCQYNCKRNVISDILYLHMICCRQSNPVQERAGCWTWYRTRRRTGCRTLLWASRFMLGFLHCNQLQYFWSSSPLSQYIKLRGGVGHWWGSSFTSVSPALTSGSYSYIYISRKTNDCLLMVLQVQRTHLNLNGKLRFYSYNKCA